MRILVLLFISAAITASGADLKCGSCHIKEAQDHSHSYMAHALATPQHNALFTKHPVMKVQKGDYSYTVTTHGSDTT